MTVKKFIRFLSISIIAVLLLEYLDYLISVFSYPYNIFMNEGFMTRISLHFYSHGLTLGNLNEYPYIVTIYGFLYELVSMPLIYILGPSINIGRIISLTSTVLSILIIIIILNKKNVPWFYIILLSPILVMFKPMTIYSCLSKNDAFTALMTLVVLYSLYFQTGSKQFFITLVFSSFAIMTKQTSVFIFPVVLCTWYFRRIDILPFLKKSLLWILLIIILFGILFVKIPNYYFNTITLSGLIGTVTTAYIHLIFDQIIPLLRGIIFLIVAACIMMFKLWKQTGIKNIITPAFLYLIFYIPVFILTSYSTGSMPVYFVFTFIGISVFIPELILKYKSIYANNLNRVWVIETLVFLQLIVYLIAPSKRDLLKFTYSNKPTETMKQEAYEIESIIKANGVERSFVTFGRSSYGLSAESAPYDFDFIHGYLLEKNKLNIEPYINDFNNKKFSVIVGGLKYPGLKDAIEKNYYLYKVIGDTPLYLPKK